MLIEGHNYKQAGRIFKVLAIYDVNKIMRVDISYVPSGKKKKQMVKVEGLPIYSFYHQRNIGGHTISVEAYQEVLEEAPISYEVEEI